jgi:hypothetical protein
VMEIAKVELELTIQSVYFFALVLLVLCYASCAGLQVTQAARDFYDFLLAASIFHPAGLVLSCSHL